MVDCYKRQQTCWWNVHALGFVPDYYKTQETCRKAVRTSPSTIHFVPEYCKT